MSGTDSLAGVGDGRLGLEALVLCLQQPDAPSVGVAVIFKAQQVAVGDRMLTGQIADRLGACQGLKGQLPPFWRCHRLGGTKRYSRIENLCLRLRQTVQDATMAHHACFLRETGDFLAERCPVWGKQVFSPNPILRHSAQDSVTLNCDLWH